jgi:hypothetical protein
MGNNKGYISIMNLIYVSTKLALINYFVKEIELMIYTNIYGTNLYAYAGPHVR